MNTQELHVVFGTGPLGMAVMRELVARGKPVRMVNRSGVADAPADVEVLPGDAYAVDSTRALAQGASVVYQCAQPAYHQWPTYFPALQAAILEGAASAGARLVFAENLYMYGEVDGPISEGLPYAAATRKGRTRAAMAEAALAAHGSGKVRVAIGRASDFYGPQVLQSAVGERVFASALAGKAADVLGDPDQPHTYTFVDDFARGLVTLGERDEALGQAWHIPSAPTLTTRRFIELVYREVGAAPKLRVAPPWMVTVLGLFVPAMRETREMLYEFEKPFVVDSSKYARAFGEHVTPHAEALRLTLDWYRGHLAAQSSVRPTASVA